LFSKNHPLKWKVWPPWCKFYFPSLSDSKNVSKGVISWSWKKQKTTFELTSEFFPVKQSWCDFEKLMLAHSWWKSASFFHSVKLLINRW
jgi:hypothetical protein